MLPHEKKPPSDDKHNPKKGKDKPPNKNKDKDSGEDQKERKRRTSLTDSPVTSSSASTTSTLDSSDEQKSSTSKNAEPTSSKKAAEESTNKDKAGPSSGISGAVAGSPPYDEDKGKKKKHKKKKKKDEKESNKEGENSGASSNFNNHDSSPLSDSQQNNDDSSNKAQSTAQSNSKSNETKLSYSTASLNTGTTTVSSTTPKMSFADGLNTDLYSTSSGFTAPLSSIFSTTERRRNPYLQQENRPGENINRLEVENAHQKVEMYDRKWMRAFHMAVVEGNFEKFIKCIHVIYNIIFDNRSIAVQNLSDRDFKSWVMMGIVNHFYDTNEHTTILMSLAATRDFTRTCEDVRHGYCKIISTILSHLNQHDINQLLQITTKRMGRTAIHFAATTGQICQLKALLKFDINPDTIDKSGSAPIHHAIERNNLEMVQLLIRYGADPWLCPRDRFKHSPRILAMANAHTELSNWLNGRLDAIDRVFKMCVNECVSRFWQIQTEKLSDVHFIRATENYNYRNHNMATKTARTGTLNIRVDLAPRCNQPRTLAVLFFMPMYFQASDKEASADNPQFFRTVFDFSDTGSQHYPVMQNIAIGLLGAPQTVLKNVVYPEHNGHYYAYALPTTLVEGSYRVEFHLDYEPFRNHANQIILAMGALLCKELDERELNNVQIKETVPNNKGKVKAKMD